jgi:hypothetical protein
MSWFQHRHYWRVKTGIHEVKNRDSSTGSCLFLEDCPCGAVRQIEYSAGNDPVIRIARPPDTTA